MKLRMVMLITLLFIIPFPEIYAEDCPSSIQVEVRSPGPGHQTEATEPELANPPDFVVEKLWFTNLGGVESYRYTLGDSFNTIARLKNIGDGSCSGDITGHFYLSKGYKEDPHSGAGAWRRIDSTNTHCSNLNPGENHVESKNTVISEWITEPGIYNIVYCIDHPLDDHNNGGDHPEKHESNNCSTEAVFEVSLLETSVLPQNHGWLTPLISYLLEN